MENKEKLYGLAFKCPFDRELKNCSLKKLREFKDFEKMIEFIDNLSSEEINKLISDHKMQK